MRVHAGVALPRAHREHALLALHELFDQGFPRSALAAGLRRRQGCSAGARGPRIALELTDVLRTACVRQRLTAQQAQAKLAQVVSLPIEVDRYAVAACELLGLALRFGLSAYDAACL